MFNRFVKRAVALSAAMATTWMLFSSVVSLADADRAALAAARVPTLIAAAGSGATPRN